MSISKYHESELHRLHQITNSSLSFEEFMKIALPGEDLPVFDHEGLEVNNVRICVGNISLREYELRKKYEGTASQLSFEQWVRSR